VSVVFIKYLLIQMGTKAQSTFLMFFGKIEVLWDKFGLDNIFL